jgi:hypothetical protein
MRTMETGRRRGRVGSAEAASLDCTLKSDRGQHLRMRLWWLFLLTEMLTNVHRVSTAKADGVQAGRAENADAITVSALRESSFCPKYMYTTGQLYRKPLQITRQNSHAAVAQGIGALVLIS